MVCESERVVHGAVTRSAKRASDLAAETSAAQAAENDALDRRDMAWVASLTLQQLVAQIRDLDELLE